MIDTRTEKIAAFVAWTQAHITGDEKGQAQIFLDRLFQAFGHAGSLDVGGEAECRIRKASEDGGGTSFADYVWKPVVLIEMKKRGVNLAKHYRQAFDYGAHFTHPADIMKIVGPTIVEPWREQINECSEDKNRVVAVSCSHQRKKTLL